MFATLPFIYFLVCGITGLILHYKMLRIIQSKGRKVSYFLMTPRQLFEFGRVIKEEKDAKLKMRYRIILWSQVGLIPLYFVGMFILLGITD
jgi:hypothetical protein